VKQLMTACEANLEERLLFSLIAHTQGSISKYTAKGAGCQLGLHPIETAYVRYI
jgi:hypothetical protein